MSSVCFNYGIAHPPGYPLYVILGKLFSLLIPFGNIAYRLNVMSALFAGLTSVIFCLTIKHLNNNSLIENKNNTYIISICSFIAAFCLAISKTLWSVSIVAEMYTINTFFIVMIIYLLLVNRHLLLSVFLLGISMGNRIDIVLITPGIFYYIVSNKEFLDKYKIFSIRSIVYLSIVFILGFSVYFYLPFRSKTMPYLNWNKPDNIQTLIETITRKTHGSTLDLISSRYTINDVLAPEMNVYFKRTFKLFSVLGIPIIILGFLNLYKKQKNILITTSIIYLIAGPLFITIAKMPPNPHALAIMDPHYLISDLMLAFWFVYGLLLLSYKLKKYSFTFFIIPVLIFASNFKTQNMRYNFNAYDFARNVFRSLPKNSIVISREDIQVFSEWYLQLVEKKRDDITVIAKGLSNSKWYQEILNKYNNTNVVSLANQESFTRFYNLNKNRNIYYTSDVEDFEMLGQNAFFTYPNFLVFNVKDKKMPDYRPIDFQEIYIRRNPLKVDSYYDIFNQKIVGQYADSLFRAALFSMNNGKIDQAVNYFERIISIKEDVPAVYFNLGWIYFQKNSLDKTEYYYKLSIKYYEKMHKDALDYRSFPEVVDSIVVDWATVHNNLGTIYEKQNKINEAINAYSNAVTIKPNYADAHYNMAVAYWHMKDWRKVIEELETTLRINPNHSDAPKYLYIAKKNLGL
ncbi:MAG: hypothetical protein A2539_10160 [Elusimicrobia bacterium RIFOXYD2_FULL_34_15]|nr:MAG: hypothetical protein A2539_10160 [Elusimicrobia bacterium RIFOXYD2_FULL_34_15]